MTRTSRCSRLGIAALLIAGCSDDGAVRSAGQSRSPSLPVATSAAPVTPSASPGSPVAVPPSPSPTAARSPSRTPDSTSRALTIQDFSFSPRTMTVPVGTAVTATNLDSATHTWTADGGVWDSGSLSQGQRFTFTFRTPGTYTFHCRPHPTMTGSIIVG